MDMPKSFLVCVSDTEGAIWQGKVTWMEQGQTDRFQSALELIRLLDRALSGAADTPPEGD